jgi:hypothetical protein
VFHIYVVSTDVLGNAPSFSLSHLCFADRVEQGSFAVIHVSHNRYHWRTAFEVFQIGCVQHLDHFDSWGYFFWGFHLYAHFFGYHPHRWNVQGFGNVDRNAFREQPLNNFGFGNSQSNC